MAEDTTSRMNDLAAVYGAAEERMRGLPVHNPALEVEIVEVRPWNGYFIGILITPWCMNLILLPRGRAECRRARAPLEIELPGGTCTCLAGACEIAEPHWLCSLISPVQYIVNQSVARAIAERVMADLLAPRHTPQNDEPSGLGLISRRRLIGGGVAD